MGPRKRVIKKPETPQTPFIYHKEHHEIVKELNKKHIENLKTENAIYDEEKELEGLRFAEERLIKQRLSDLDLFEQKIIKKSKKVVNRNKLVKVLKSLKQPKQLLHDDNCKKYQMKHVAWSSPTYIIRHIRSSLLNHDWPNLTNLLLLLLNHKRRYFSYINEISFLNFLMNDVDNNSEMLDEFIQKCFIKIDANYKETPFDVIYETSTV